MYFYNLVLDISKNNDLMIFIDMDGVVADYKLGFPLDFKEKRPLKTNIKTLEKIGTLPNVELAIISICKINSQIQDKIEWLDKYMPYIKKENINILSKEKYPGLSSKEIKYKFLKNYKTNKQILVIDDDNEILKYLSKNIDNIILFQDSSLID